MDKEQRRRLPQPVGQPGYRRQHHRRLPTLIQEAVGRRLLSRQILGFHERYRPQHPFAQHPERLVSDDAAQSARKRRRVGKARQRGPCRHKGFLRDVLGLVEAVHQGQRRTEGHMLELSRQVHENLDVAGAGAADLLFAIHFRSLTPLKCQETAAAFNF
jgi:hypothetical protein